jgi:hypothetical protein
LANDRDVGGGSETRDFGIPPVEEGASTSRASSTQMYFTLVSRSLNALKEGVDNLHELPEPALREYLQ